MTQMTLMTLRTGMTLMKQWHWWPWWQIVFEKFLNMSSISISSFFRGPRDYPTTLTPGLSFRSVSIQHRDRIWTFCFYLKKNFQASTRRPKIKLDPLSTRRLRKLDAPLQEVQIISKGIFNRLSRIFIFFKRYNLFLKVFSLSLVACFYFSQSCRLWTGKKIAAQVQSWLDASELVLDKWYWIW